jgi:hypothetical protein
MLVLVPFLLLFVMLGLLWVIAAGLLVGNLITHAPRVLRMLNHKGDHCACYLGMKHHHGA